MTKRNNVPKEKIPCLKSLRFNYYLFNEDELDYNLEELKEDFEIATNYFKGKQRDFIYPKEAELLIALIYRDVVTGEDSINDLFIESPKEETDSKVEELNRNLTYLINRLKENNKFNLSLFLWTIFKTFHYFSNKSKYSTYKQNSFVLIKSIIELDRALIHHDSSYTFDDIAHSDAGDIYYITGTCVHLIDDLMCSIAGEFPSRTYKPMIFIGYNLHYPAGCCQMVIEMQSFYKFIRGITDYDFWITGDSDYGKEVFFKKLHLRWDYKKLLSEVFNEN